MISRIGIDQRSSLIFQERKGITFIEVMITIVVLSVGIVMIFKSFFLSLDQMNHLTTRLYATTLLDNRISAIERMLKTYQALPFEWLKTDTVAIGQKDVNFIQELHISEVDDFLDIFKVDLSVKWTEGTKEKRISRSAYIADFAARSTN